MCSKEPCPLHLIYLKFPFFLAVPAPARRHIIQVTGSCLCFWQAKAKDLLCVISWTPRVALQITKGDARFLRPCHSHIFIYNLHLGDSWQIFSTFSFCQHESLCLWRGGCSSLPWGEPIPGGSCSLSLPTASWQNAPLATWEASVHLLHHIQLLLPGEQPPRGHRGWKLRS